MAKFKTRIKSVKPDFGSQVQQQEKLTEAHMTGTDIGDTSKHSSVRVVREEIIDGKRFKALTVG